MARRRNHSDARKWFVLAAGTFVLSGVVGLGYAMSRRDAKHISVPDVASAPINVPVTTGKSAEILSQRVELSFRGFKRAFTWQELGATIDKDGGSSEWVLDRPRTEAILQQLKADWDEGPRNARLDLEARKVHPDKPGFGIEMFASVSALEAALRDGAKTVSLDGAEIPASVTVETLGISDISTVMGFYQTTFPVVEKARNDNLKLLASHFDGIIVQPGQEISFNAASGDRTEKEGYKIAHVITAGEMVDGMAGGSCQISTTLHGAAFFAGLEIVKTTPHSRPSTYVPLGFDSTVVYPNIDLVFKNPFDFPIAVSYKVARGVARAEILGAKKPFDKVEFVREVKEEKPFETITREDDTIAMGYMVIDQPGYPGYKMIRSRNAYKAGKVVKTDKWTLNYPPVVEYVRMGVNPDPNLPPPAVKKSHMPTLAKDSKFSLVQ